MFKCDILWDINRKNAYMIENLYHNITVLTVETDKTYETCAIVVSNSVDHTSSIILAWPWIATIHF